MGQERSDIGTPFGTPYGAPFGTPVIAASAWVHPSATIIGNVTLGEDVSVWPGAVLRGERVTIGHRAVVHGCTVEDGALIGIGAIVLNGAVIGAGSLVAAGARVGEGKRIPPDSVGMGVPGRVLGELSDEQRERVRNGHATYVALKERYRAAV